MNNRHFGRFVAMMAVIVLMVPALALASSETFPFVAYTIEMLSLRVAPSGSAREKGTVPAQSAVAVTGEGGDYYVVVYEGLEGYAPKQSLSRTLAAGDSQAMPLAVSTRAAVYPALSTGDSGDMVEALQQALIELEFLSGRPDGKYGPATAGGISKFQDKNNLPANGIADPETQKFLFEERVYNAKGRRQDVKVVPPAGTHILRPDDYGKPIVQMQQRLKDLSYYSGSVDGVYGNATRLAVVEFQKSNGLKADGIAGENTQSILFGEALAKDAVSTPKTAATQPASVESALLRQEELPASYPYTTLTIDSVNLRKRASTSAMRIMTVPTGSSIRVNSVSGDFLNITYRDRTGFVHKDYVEIPDRYLPGKAFEMDTAARVRYEALGQGSSGNKVKALQQALSELGFFSGEADGKYGTATQQAVRKFQEKNEYKATGIALPELQKLLYEGKPRNNTNRRVYVATLPPITNPDIQLGDKGDAVTTLQQTLTDLNFYKGEIDGTFGRSTSNAVKSYQKAHSIKQTGKMDSFTWMSINAVIAPSGQNGVDQGDYLTEENVIVMKRGTRGLAVTRLQERLIELGYYLDTPDGVYKNADINAVRAFQRNNGLTSSGTADLFTQRALYSVYAVPGSETPPENWQSLATPTAAPATPAPKYETLRIGSSGDTVKALQTRLVGLNYLRGNADGIFGTQTAQAVSAFQKTNSLAADGIAGQATLTRLYSGNAAQNIPAPLPSVKDDGNLVRTLQTGDRGEDVKEVQRKLITYKYLSGGADGIYGPKTALAVQAFQSRNSLKNDGMVGSLTWAKMNSSAAIAQSSLPVVPVSPTAPTLPTTPGFSAPRAAEVRFAQWTTEIKARARSMPNVIIYDFASDSHYNVHMFSLGAHADGEPVTKEDTATMNAALGTNNWTPRPVWVMFSDGRVYMGSTHSRGHEVDHNAGNNLTGHICIHFPRDVAEAAATGPYAVSHQNAILSGWDYTQLKVRAR